MRLSLAAALFLSPCFERASFAQTVRAPRTVVPIAGIPAAAPAARSSMDASSLRLTFSPSFSGPAAFSAAPVYSAPAVAPPLAEKLSPELAFAARASAELAAAADDLGEERGLKSSGMTGAGFAALLEDARLRLLESGMSKAPSPEAVEAAGIVMEQIIRVVRALAAPEKPLNESVRRVLSIWQVFNQEMEVAARTGTLAAVVEEARLFARQVEESVDEASSAPTAAASAARPVPPAMTAGRDSVSAMAAVFASVEGLDGAAMKAEAGAGFEDEAAAQARPVRGLDGSGPPVRLQAAPPSASGGRAEEVPGSIFDWKPVESSPGHGFAPLDFLVRKLLAAKAEGFSQGFEFRGAAQRSQAQVFFYGERHSDKELIAENMRRLAADMKPGGRVLVLVEGHLDRPMTGSEAVRYLQERGFDPAALREKGISPSAVEVRGWDKAENYERSKTPLLQHQVNLFELNELAHGPDRGLGYYVRLAGAGWKTLGNWAKLWRLAIAARNDDLDSAVAEASAEAAAEGATLHVIAGSSHLVRRPLFAELGLPGGGGFRKALKNALGGRPYWASAPPHTVEPPHLLVRRAESPRELARLARRFAAGLRRTPDTEAARAYVNGLWELAEAPPSKKAHAAAARALKRELKEGRADGHRLLVLRAVKALAGRTPFEAVERNLVKAALALSERSPRRAVSREAAFVAESVAVLSPFASVRRLALRHYRDIVDRSGDDSRVADAERAAARLAVPLPRDYWPAWKSDPTP